MDQATNNTGGATVAELPAGAVTGGAVSGAATPGAKVTGSPGATPLADRIDYEVCDTIEALRATKPPTEKQKPFMVTLPALMLGALFPADADKSGKTVKYVYANNSDMAVTRVCRKLGASAEGVDSKRKPKEIDTGKVEDALSKMTPEARNALLSKYLAGKTPTVVSGEVGNVSAPASQSMPEFDAKSDNAGKSDNAAKSDPAKPAEASKPEAKSGGGIGNLGGNAKGGNGGGKKK